MRKHLILSIVILIAFLLSVALIAGVSAQQDSDNDGISDVLEEQLAKRYEPVLHFASGEEFFPTDVNYHIDNSELYMKLAESNMLIDASPTETSIAQHTTENYFLNNTLGGSERIAQDYTQKRGIYGDKIYAHVTSEGQNIVVQYWFFYAYNPGSLNQHQGDWEMIEIVLDSNENPVFAVYSQHHAGEKAEWQDVETIDDTHPEVYVALGSHANYFRYYQGKLGTESDTVGNAYTLSPEELEMIILGEIGEANHPVSQDWLEFGGRWGDWAELVDAYFGAAGPSGPGHDENMEKWYYPASWGSDKFQVTGSWFTASLVVYYLAYIIAAIIGIIALYKIWKIIKRQREGRLNLMKILHSKAALGIIIGIIGVAVYLVALFLPWYTVTGNINTTLIDTAGTTEIVLIDGLNGLRINMIQGNQGLTTLFGLGIPFGIIFLGNVIMNALDIIGVEKPKDLSRTYIISAFTSLIPLIIIIAFIVALTGVVTSVAGSVTGGQPIPQQVNDIVSAMSSAPFGGGFTDTLDSVGTIDIAWGLAIGSFMFIAASAIKLIAGIMLRVSKAS